MLQLADHFRRVEAAQWKKRFGTEFTGEHEGRPVHYAWLERVTGHVCTGADPFNHLECLRITQWQWCWLRGKAKGK